MKTQLHSFKILIIATILFFPISFVNAQRVASVTGNWSNTATWGGAAVPTSAETVTISGGVIVTVDIGTAACASLTLNVNNNNSIATISFNNGSVLTISGNLIAGNTTGVSRQGSIDMTNGGTLKIGGTVTINNLNTFTGGTGTVEYTSANPTIVSNFVYQNLAFSGSGTAGASGALTIQGNLTNTGGGTLNFGANNVILSGTTAANNIAGFTTTGTVSMTKTSGTATFTGNVNGGGFAINGTGGTLNLGAALTHTLTGAWTRTAGTLIGGSSVLKLGGSVSGSGGTFTPSIGTVEWNGAGAQTLAALSYFNLTLSNSGAKTITGSTVNGTLSLQGTATAAGTSPTFGGSSTLAFAGSSAQTSTNVEFPSSGGPVNLTINNGSGVTLHAARTINGVVTFTSGILNTTATNLLTFNNGATTPGSSNTSFVNGPVRKIFNATESFTFPVGVAGTGDEPLGITGAALNDDFTAQYLRSSATAMGGVISPILNVSRCDQWTLTKNSAPPANVGLTLSWDANSPCNANAFVTNPATLTIGHFNGTAWDEAGTSSGGYTGNATTGTVTRNNVTVFSPFSLANTAEGENPLPVKFGNIKGYAKNGGIQIDWSIYTEYNVDHYEIERSANGLQQFASIGQTQARNANSKTEYGWIDATPLNGNNFYRIKSVDFDGKISYSVIIRVNLNHSGKDIIVYPNPAQNGYVSFQTANLQKGDYTLKIINTNGQEVYKQKFVHEGGAYSQTISLPAGIRSGMYNLRLINGNEITNKTFIIQ